MKIIALLVVLISVQSAASPPNKYNLLIAPGTLAENSVTFLWDKQYNNGIIEYEIFLNGKLQGITSKTNYTIHGLTHSTAYKTAIRIKGEKQRKN